MFLRNLRYRYLNHRAIGLFIVGSDIETGIIYTNRAGICLIDVLDKFNRLFEHLHRHNLFSGNVLVGESGQRTFTTSVGIGNQQNGVLLSAESMFEIASLAKAFTAMAVAILLDRQKLHLSDTVAKYFPQLKYENVTIENLVTHTSGLPDYISWFEKNWDKSIVATNTDVLGFLRDECSSLLFTPGERWAYSNTGYVLLANIVELVSGMEYADFLRQEVFTPLGMTRTQVFSRRLQPEPPDYAYGYLYFRDRNESKLPDVIDEHSYVRYLDGIKGDGQISSTIGDLFLWDQALYTDTLVSRPLLNQVFQPAVVNGHHHGYCPSSHSDNTGGYGFGWNLEMSERFGKIACHGGYWAGYCLGMSRYIDNEKTIIYLSNRDYAEPSENKIHNDIIMAMENILFGLDFELPKL